MHLVLGDDRGVLDVLARLRLPLDRQVGGQRLLRDYNRGGVDAVLAAHALEAPGHPHNLGHVVVAVDHGPKLGRGLVAVRELRDSPRSST